MGQTVITRMHDPDLVREALKLYPFEDIDLDVDSWIADPDNIVLSDDRGNLGLFELSSTGVYNGHYFFKDRGRYAINLAVEMLATVFEKYRAEMVQGLTPTKHKAALWMNRQLGFQSHGVTDTWRGPHEIVILTKNAFKEKWA